MGMGCGLNAGGYIWGWAVAQILIEICGDELWFICGMGCGLNVVEICGMGPDTDRNMWGWAVV